MGGEREGKKGEGEGGGEGREREGMEGMAVYLFIHFFYSFIDSFGHKMDRTVFVGDRVRVK